MSNLSIICRLKLFFCVICCKYWRDNTPHLGQHLQVSFINCTLLLFAGIQPKLMPVLGPRGSCVGGHPLLHGYCAVANIVAGGWCWHAEHNHMTVIAVIWYSSTSRMLLYSWKCVVSSIGWFDCATLGVRQNGRVHGVTGTNLGCCY